MFEVFFIYTVSLFPLIAFAVIFSFMLIFFKLKHLKKLAKINILKRQQYCGNSLFFASYIIDLAVTKLFFTFSPQAKSALIMLAGGRTFKAADFFKNQEPALAFLLKAITKDISAPRWFWQNKSYISNPQFQIFALVFAQIKFDEKNMKSLFNRCTKIKFSKRLKAYFYYLSAFSYMREADMLSASQNASLALKLFKKYNYLFEEAQCYLLLAEIYRISCINDIAQTMIESAIKIYHNQNLPLLNSQATAVLAMLMLFENRFEEAEDKFNLALNLAENQRTIAEIRNQFALLNIAQQNIKQAQKNASLALDIHVKLNNLRGKAFSLQILSHIYSKQQKYVKSANFAKEAAELYFKQANFSAYAECLYMRACALCKTNHYKKAEILLREILEIYKTKSLNFHVANAYSLLGLIYLQTQDMQRAKVLFQQSLHMEQRNSRCSGMAADYTNLAIIEAHSGNNSAFKDNLNTALDYAKQTDDKALIELIKNTSALLK